MAATTEKSELLRQFASLDAREKDTRAKIDMLIKTNALEELTKEQEQKKEKFAIKRRTEEEANTIVITKKVSQADKKKALKAKKREGEAKDEDN